MDQELLIALLIVLLLAALVVGRQVYRKLKKLRVKQEEVSQRTETLQRLLFGYQQRVANYRERFDAIEPHLSDYFNTIPLSSHPSVHGLRSKIAAHEEGCHRVAELLSTPGVAGFEQTIKQLDSILASETRAEADGLPKGWGTEIDELIQFVGCEIHTASTKQEFDLPRARDRRPTLDSLKIAGVLIEDEE